MADKKVSELDAIIGADTASDDLFLIVDSSGSVTKKITREELNNAIERDVLSSIDINGGTIDATPIGGTTPAAGSFTTVGTTGDLTAGANIVVTGTVDGRDVAADGTKLDGVEASADVTDATNVQAAGALMDSELTSEASVKALNQGVATTDDPSFVDATFTGTGAVKMPAGTTAQRPTAAQGQIRFNTTDTTFEGYDGSAWGAIGGDSGEASLILYEYTATSGQTTFSGSDDNAATLSYTADNLQVVMNGIVLDPSDYTATNGTSVVLASGAAANDLVNIYAFKSFTVADTVSASAGGTFNGNIVAPKYSTTTTKIETAIFRVNAQSLGTNTTIDADENALATGPLTVGSGVTLTVTSGGTLVIA